MRLYEQWGWFVLFQIVSSVSGALRRLYGHVGENGEYVLQEVMSREK